MKVLLIASSGGHIYELLSLRAFWGNKDRYWVSFPTADAEFLLKGEDEVYWAAYPTVRNVSNLLRNIRLAVTLLTRNRPDMILTTGSGVAAPFAWCARVLGIPCVFIESITRITELSLTARLVKPFVTKLLVQWPELTKRYSRVEYHGGIV